jgi:hypothetical protein
MKFPKLSKLTIIFTCISIGILVFIGYKVIQKIKLPKKIENKVENEDENNDKKTDDDENGELIKDRIDISCLLKDDSDKNLITIVPNIKNKDKVGNLKKQIENKKQIVMSAKRKSRKKTENTLRKIINTILANSSVKSLLKIDETEKFTKTYYKSVMINLGLEPGNMKIKDMLQAIMISLPTVSVIENIIDEIFSLNSMSNKEDRECVVLYLEKKIQ